MLERTQVQVFIGSSGRALEYATALQSLLLDRGIDAEVWNQSVIDLSQTTIEGLIQASREVDFGVFLLTPDDLLKAAVNDEYVPRDNVLFEIGLFMGRLGRDRVFLVYQSNRGSRILSDLAGVTYAPFNRPDDATDLKRALRPAAVKIRDHIERIGPRRVSRRFNSVKEAHDFMYGLMRDPEIRTIHQMAVSNARFTFSTVGTEFSAHIKEFLQRDGTRFWYLYRPFEHLPHRQQLADDLRRDFRHCAEVCEASTTLPQEPSFGFLVFGNKYVVLVNQPEMAEGTFTRASGFHIMDLCHRFFRAVWSSGLGQSRS